MVHDVGTQPHQKEPDGQKRTHLGKLCASACQSLSSRMSRLCVQVYVSLCKWASAEEPQTRSCLILPGRGSALLSSRVQT